MTLVRFRLPEIALLTCLVTIWPLTPAYGQAPPAPRRPTPPAPSLMPPAFSSVPAATTTPVPAQTPAQPPAAAGQAPIAGQAAVATAATAAATVGGLNLQNVNLSEVIDFLARELKINYILDKRLNLGGVTLNTYGEVKDMDKRALLDTILRINGAAMVQTGAIYRIVPLADLPRMPLRPEVDAKSIPEDDQAMLNLIFLKYANVDELSKLIGEFLGPEGKAWSYPPANLLLLLDSRRSMRRTMEMIALFDSDLLAKQRVRLFEIKYSRPSDLSRELADLLKSMSLSKDLSSVKFVPVDRINTLIAVAPNPGVFDQVQEWISRLDLRVKSAAGRTTSYTYRVRYGNAQMLAMSIMMLYAQIDPLMAASLPMGMGMMGMGMMGGMGGYGMMGGYGGMGGMGGYGMMGGYGGMGGMGGYGMMGGMGGYGMMGGFPGMMGMLGGYPGMYGNYGAVSSRFGGSAVGVAPQGGTGVADQTGQFLSGSGAAQPTGGVYQGPRVVPNPTDNSLLILATPDEYESILRLLHELDIPPRQVLIEAKIYEVRLTGAFSWGLSSYLQSKGAGAGDGTTPGRQSRGSASGSAGLNFSAGMLIGQSRELLALLNTREIATHTKVVSNPSVVATDSIPASINVGVDVPTLSSQAVTGAQQGGNSLFANTISNRRTGVTLNITARVNPSGIVTLIINQEVSAPQAPDPGGIQSPSFSNRNVNTQVTVQDGDLVAIGGIISETGLSSTAGVPLLHRVPVLGYAFGSKSTSKERTELLIFLTPRVIYDTNQLTEASDELMTNMRRLQKLIRD